MRIMISTLISILLYSQMSLAADVVCSCKGQQQQCSDIKISFVPSNPGVYMTVEYAYGAKNLEGFASIVRSTQSEEVQYKLRSFVLIEKEGQYSLPNRPAQCN